jgi:hypothetical protein
MIGNYLNSNYYAVVHNPSNSAITIPAGTTITYYYILF